MRSSTRTLGLALMLALPACASAQQPTPMAHPDMAHPDMAEHAMMMHGTRIHVATQGTAHRAPEQAVVRLAVETAAKSAQGAAKDNADKMERIIAALRRLDIPRDQIQTVGYNMYPQYEQPAPRPAPGTDQEPQQPRIVGYHVMNMVSVTVDGAERAGAVIDAALGAGANRVDGLDFRLKDTDSARAEALGDAMSRARAEAMTLAKAAGLTLGEPIEISTTGSISSPPPPMPMYARAESAMATPVEPGQLEITASVDVVYIAQP